MKRRYLAYGLRDNVLTSISEVETGLACGCVCPHCKGQLVAKKKAARRVAHFAHKTKECDGWFETTIHLLAKNILQSSNIIMLPPVSSSFRYSNYPQILSKVSSLRYDTVLLEKSLGKFVPDAIICFPKKELIIEFAVTHFCDQNKIDEISTYGVSAIEIDLSGIDENCENLSDFILNRTDNKKWLFSFCSEMPILASGFF